MQNKESLYKRAKRKAEPVLQRIEQEGQSRELLGELWEAVLPLVKETAWRYGGSRAEDLTQEGYFIMLRALADHDRERMNFTSYLLQRLMYAYARLSGDGTIKLPSYIRAKVNQADREIARIEAATSRVLTEEEKERVRGWIKAPSLKGRIAAHNASRLISLDTPLEEAGEDTLHDVTGAEDAALLEVEDDIFMQGLREALMSELGRLPAWRAKLIERIYLNEEDPQEVGSDLGISKEKAREMARNGIEQMKKQGARTRLRPWADECGLYSTSFRSWKHTGMSAPERIAIQRAERLERWKEQYYAKRANGQ